MRLVELFNKTAEWEWSEGEWLRNNTSIANFTVGNIPYLIQFDKETYDVDYLRELFEIENDYATICDVMFTMRSGSTPKGKRGIDVTGTGNAYEVFATVKEITESFLNQNADVDYLHFEAGEESRIKLYDRFVSQFGGQAQQTLDKDAEMHYLVKV